MYLCMCASVGACQACLYAATTTSSSQSHKENSIRNIKFFPHSGLFSSPLLSRTEQSVRLHVRGSRLRILSVSNSVCVLQNSDSMSYWHAGRQHCVRFITALMPEISSEEEEWLRKPCTNNSTPPSHYCQPVYSHQYQLNKSEMNLFLRWY